MPADLPAGVEALGREGAEEGGPVGLPGCWGGELRLADEVGDAGADLVEELDGFVGAVNGVVWAGSC